MTALHDRANVLLILLLAAAVSGTAIIAVMHGYSQDVLDHRANELTENLADCENGSQQLADYISTAKADVNVSKESVRKYDILYTQTVAELNATNVSLQQTQSSLTGLRLEHERLQWYADALNISLAERDTTIKSLGANLIRLRDQLHSCTASLAHCLPQ